jgi:hypothetical protein
LGSHLGAVVGRRAQKLEKDGCIQKEKNYTKKIQKEKTQNREKSYKIRK